MARDYGYYWVHYTNLDTRFFGTQTGFGLGYYGFDKANQWNLWVWSQGKPGLSSGQIVVQDADLDEVYPPLRVPVGLLGSPSPPDEAGFWWVYPNPTLTSGSPTNGWLLAWGITAHWSAVLQDRRHLAEYRKDQIERWGPGTSAPSP